MSDEKFRKRLTNLFWYILTAVLMTCGTFLFTSYITVQSIKENDIKQNLLIEQKANVEMVETIKIDCKEEIESIKKEYNDKIIQSNQSIQEKFDLIIKLIDKK